MPTGIYMCIPVCTAAYTHGALLCMEQHISDYNNVVNYVVISMAAMGYIISCIK